MFIPEINRLYLLFLIKPRCLYPDCLSGAVAQKNQFFLSPLFGVRDSIMQNFKFTSMNLNFKEGIENSKDLNQMTEVKV
ncbi:unnamed protein product [Rhizophagus irregularis]|nr:unnamed protein product [Rhizophagus irregularis]CAB5309080.1 unnamed protein product [Rhizophagus irregularis]